MGGTSTPTSGHSCPAGRGRSGERELAEQFLDPAQVPHPGLGLPADPAADRLHRHPELAGGRLVGQALAAQGGRHPVGEGRLAGRRRPAGRGPPLRARRDGGRARLPAAGSGRWSAGRPPRRARGRCGTRPGSRRSARPRRAGRGRRSRRPPGCPPPSAATRPGSGGRSRGSRESRRGGRGTSGTAPPPGRPRSARPRARGSGQALPSPSPARPASQARPACGPCHAGYVAAAQTCPLPGAHLTSGAEQHGLIIFAASLPRGPAGHLCPPDRRFSLVLPRPRV